VIGQKSGVVSAVDPDHDGKELWQTRIGQGGPLGGVMYGGSADDHAVYVSVADGEATAPFAPGGLTALDLQSGRILWHAAPPPPICCWGREDCSAAQPGATTLIQGVIFSGSLDGHLRAVTTKEGKIIWDYDTAAGAYHAINGVPGHGGSISAYPLIIGNGALYLNSGGSLLSHPGNVLLTFSVDGK
jgi:polyvinyl alcohol dehydrogenase (cytochrome)